MHNSEAPEGRIPRAGDTYFHARKIANEQIASERVVHDQHDDIERQVLMLWDEHIEIPYGKNVMIRIRSDLPIMDHNKIILLLKSIPDEVDEGVNPFTEMLEVLTMGLYSDGKLITQTDGIFWGNPQNWSMLKIQRIISGYLQNYKQEMDAVTSFLAGPA